MARAATALPLAESEIGSAPSGCLPGRFHVREPETTEHMAARRAESDVNPFSRREMLDEMAVESGKVITNETHANEVDACSAAVSKSLTASLRPQKRAMIPAATSSVSNVSYVTRRRPTTPMDATRSMTARKKPLCFSFGGEYSWSSEY